MKRMKRVGRRCLCGLLLLCGTSVGTAHAAAASASVPAAATLAAPVTLPVAVPLGQEGVAWLGKVVGAAREQNYSGTFVYRNGGHGETSRITHLVQDGRELERLEVLDGSPREVIREGDVIRCYLPETRTLIIEKRDWRGAFPVMLPTSLAGLTEFYDIRKGALERIAGRDAQVVVLEPRDAWRYGHKFWVDTDSGLLLKAGMLDERNGTVETFAFTQLQVGGAIDRESLKPKFDTQMQGWRILDLQAGSPRQRNDRWLFKVSLPGFRKIADMKRRSFHRHRGSHAGAAADDAAHLVFSDGIASISVFIEPLGDKPVLGEVTLGAVNIYRRAQDGHLIIVLGEVPRRTLKVFGDGIELRTRP